MIKVIGFDLDDTLWAVTPVIIRAEQKLQAFFGEQRPDLDLSREAMATYREGVVSADPTLGHRITELRRRVLEAALIEAGDDTLTAQTLSEAGIEVFLRARNEIEFFDGALETLESLANRYSLGALSNGNADIKRIGLQHVFSFAYSAEEVAAPKPAPDLFHAALQRTGADPTEMVYVGDNPEHDIDPANRCGLHTVWVDNGRREPGQSKPDVSITDIRELPNAIGAIEARSTVN